MSIPAGIYWVRQFPTSKTTAILKPPFRRNVQKYILALEAGGAVVSIAATQRPPERAYLMRGCWEDIVEDRTTQLYALGASYGVKKLVSDLPHWSTTGK